ncbi:hypothetical protein BN2475_340064 [Paraburkholderia ribeironis]|uniref:Uncharacterized protein n=1 Tax=Paraburkholderia ribeironis TaxID=1247936 RepID=A0A1N7S3V0_9BURK|nr:hypothetical protein BN2475_340064 [Paraburkholderia ribeironis]
MPPVDTPMSQMHGLRIVELAVFLPQFVGEKKRDDEQRNDQESAQYQVFEHSGLRSQEHVFIVEHRTCPHRAALLITAR